MLYQKIFIIIVLYCLITSSETAKRRFKLEFYNYTCKSFNNRIKLFECSFQKLDYNLYTFHELLMFDKDLDKYFDIRLRIDIKQQHMKTNVRFIDIRLSICDALANSFQNLLLKGLLDELRRSSNVPYMCPFKGNVLYKIQNFNFSEKNLPTYMPDLNFTFTLEFFENSKLFGITKITGGAAPK